MSSEDQDHRTRMLALRAEMEREGFVFATDEQEFTLDEDIVITQGRSSVANQGSGALHTYIKDTRREEMRRKKQQEEWEKMVFRLEQLKKERKLNEELAKQSKNKAKNQKQKARKRQKKNGGSDTGSDSDGDLDLAQLFAPAGVGSLVVGSGEVEKKTDDVVKEQEQEQPPTAATSFTTPPVPTDNTTSSDTDPLMVDVGEGMGKKRKATVDLEEVVKNDDEQDKEREDAAQP